jgi:hypothetical protein
VQCLYIAWIVVIDKVNTQSALQYNMFPVQNMSQYAFGGNYDTKSSNGEPVSRRVIAQQHKTIMLQAEQCSTTSFPDAT